MKQFLFCLKKGRKLVFRGHLAHNSAKGIWCNLTHHTSHKFQFCCYVCLPDDWHTKKMRETHVYKICQLYLCQKGRKTGFVTVVFGGSSNCYLVYWLRIMTVTVKAELAKVQTPADNNWLKAFETWITNWKVFFTWEIQWNAPKKATLISNSFCHIMAMTTEFLVTRTQSLNPTMKRKLNWNIQHSEGSSKKT